MANNERTDRSRKAQMPPNNERTDSRTQPAASPSRSAPSKYKKIIKKTEPSTVRPLARDPRVLIGWPLPLGFGLGGRLLLTGTAWAGLCLIHHNHHIKKKQTKTPNRETRASIQCAKQPACLGLNTERPVRAPHGPRSFNAVVGRARPGYLRIRAASRLGVRASKKS